ncbi:FUSC family protein [Pelagibacterium flavum]|uniref:FUSC family protein n=1 Tax=Pelagibacterium flavum TaxID=2984530 RepID=A0ABY6INX9_9HYPH|nr:FUSC family protein [Pelagibacterium sp. YIM 151497]UYQ70965.1 FUSC family protein [Pelagibacterium sp. YIM 151497]
MGGGNKGSTSGSRGGYSWDGGSASKFDAEGFNNMLGSDMARAYKQGPTATYGKSLYTGMGSTTNQGMGGLLDAARQNQGFMDGGIDYAQGLIGAGPSLTENTLMDVAQGNRMGEAAPGFAAMRSRLQDDVLSGVGSQFTSSGRFGGGSHINTATDRLTDSLGALDYQNYQNDIARQERALGAIEGQRQQGVVNSMGAAAALPGMYQASLAPAQTILGVGQAQDADAQAKRLADYELFQRTSDPAYQHLAKYQGLLGAQASGPQPEQQPGLFDWLGLGIAGAGTFL